MPHRAMTDAHILIVDDQESNVRLLERLLRLKGYEQIESLTDSRLAVQRFIATRPDLVLLDLRMPHLSGLEVLEELHPLIGAQMARREGLPRSAWGRDLGRDGDNGLDLYRANVYPRLRSPRPGLTDVPVQIVVARRDPFMSPQTFDAMDFDRFLSTWHRVDVDSGHWVPRSDPELVARLVADWAQQHPGR